MKNKEILFEFKNDWKQCRGNYNWYIVTFVEFYVEYEKWLKGISCQFTLFGLGIYIRFNYDVEFLEKFLTDKSEELD